MELPIAVQREGGTPKPVEHYRRLRLLLCESCGSKGKEQQNEGDPSIPMRTTSVGPHIDASFFSWWGEETTVGWHQGSSLRRFAADGKRGTDV
jgi:hypothetical protein